MSSPYPYRSGERGRTAETVSNPHSILIKACRGARRAPTNPALSTVYRAHAVRPYARNLGQPTFETVSAVLPYSASHIPEG